MYGLSSRFVRTHDQPTTTSQLDVPKPRRRASWLIRALSRKSSPTVSVVTTNAACLTTSSNPLAAIAIPGLISQAPASSVPFPSAPIPVPSAKAAAAFVHYPLGKHQPFPPYTLDDLDDQGHDKGIPVCPSPNSPPWHIQLHQRRRSQSCLVQTYFHTENKEVAAPLPPLRTRKDQPRHRATSGSVPPGIVITKPVIQQPRPRKTSRKQADMHFLAAVYRSIKWSVESRTSEPKRLEVLEEQDKLFLVRLHDNLLLQGCLPSLLDLSSSPASTQLSLSELDAPSSPVLGLAPVALSPELLTAPQVVASLILRRRDRASVRPRSAPPATRVAKGSPLRECVSM
ncbi:hypothetical protein OE88DRAFT_1668569 [Heliocybe sulcata]|uniref:Uncharacterized protein n=1 Tax=Heliocybe sulcata TaxID=5364 RepID=A0A5C3MKV8_9AGAM|nr:hypothetical protein OE88DRAFT_1668569 [Heliocybe sulcata]